MSVETPIKAQTCNSNTSGSAEDKRKLPDGGTRLLTLGGTSISEGKNEILDGFKGTNGGSHFSSEWMPVPQRSRLLWSDVGNGVISRSEGSGG